MPPPPGVTPSLDQGPSSLSPIWLAAYIVELVVPTILVVLRYVVKIGILKSWGLADTTCLLAWCLFVCAMGLGIEEINNGVGTPAWDITAEQFANFARTININQIVYMPSICLTKVTILLQFIDLFAVGNSKRKWVLWVLICCNTVFFTALMFVEIFECTPRAKIWEPSREGMCVNIQQTFIATAVINVVDDLCIILLPIFWVLKLKMALSKKLRLCGIFAIGIFAVCCSIVRLAESIITVSDPNLTVAIVPVSLWAMAEISSALVVACLPSLSRLFRRSTEPPSAQQTYRSSSKRRATTKKRQWWSVVGGTNGVAENDDRSYVALSEIPNPDNSDKAMQVGASDENNVGNASTTPFAIPLSGINRTVVIQQTVESRDQAQGELATGPTSFVS